MQRFKCSSINSFISLGVEQANNSDYAKSKLEGEINIKNNLKIQQF